MGSERNSGGPIVGRRGIAVGAILGAALVGVFPSLGATDFIRGDVNGDGSMTFSDGAYLHNYIYRGGPPPECGNAADYDDNGVINYSDMQLIYKHMFFRWLYRFDSVPPPQPPFPEPGPDPTPGAATVPSGLAAAPCDSYGSGAPLDDPTAEVRVVDAVLPGGDDRLGLITIAMTFSRPLAGYVFYMNDDLGLIPSLPANEAVEFRDLTAFDSYTGQAHYNAKQAKLRVTNVRWDEQDIVVPASQDQEVCQLLFCVRAGKAAGEYPLTLEAAELIDAETGRSIYPRLVSGTITILDDVTDGEVEDDHRCQSSDSEFARVFFELGEGTGAPGTTAKVPFSVNSDSPLQAFTYSIDFDEQVLQATGTEVRWSRPSGDPWRFERFEIDNETGYLVGSAIISLALEGEAPPLDEDVELLRFDFDVHPEAPLGPSAIRFRNGGLMDGEPVINSAVAGFRTTEPNPSSVPLLVGGLIGIVGDISAFLRGDANDDAHVDISDPIATLGFLFLGEGRIRCPDAADANDDGRIDISDPLATLGHLFNASDALPPPAGEKGRDPTEDGLGCYGSGP